jgi:alpha-amylase
MMQSQTKALCLNFTVHQPFRLKRYRFFDLGKDHYYYDDYANESIMKRVAERCYLPANKLLLKMIQRSNKQLRFSFSISGSAIDQFRLYAPEVLDSFRELVATGAVELLAETASHSLAAMHGREEFEREVKSHAEMLEREFGVRPSVIRNSEMVYSDLIGEWMAGMGFRGALTEGAKQILGWKSPGFLYCNVINPRLKLLLRNFTLSDDLAIRFSSREWSEWPLTAEKYVSWIKETGNNSELINIFLEYETFGEYHTVDSGIFSFLEKLPEAVWQQTSFTFMTPSETISRYQPVSAVQVPSPISWADEERDLTAWLGNELQSAAFEKLYSLGERVIRIEDEAMRRDFSFLKSSDHFHYMSTKFFSDGALQKYYNPYDTPYDAFMNYMNVLSDLEIRVNRELPESSEELFTRRLRESEKGKDAIIEKQLRELTTLRKRVSEGQQEKRSSTRKSTAKKSGTGKVTAPKSSSKQAGSSKSRVVKNVKGESE